MAKRTIRTLIRQGWTEIQVPRKNLYNYDPNLGIMHHHKDFGDHVYMQDIIDWCQQRFDSRHYSYAMPPKTLWCRQYDHRPKRFVFKNSQDAVMFAMRWV